MKRTVGLLFAGVVLVMTVWFYASDIGSGVVLEGSTTRIEEPKSNGDLAMLLETDTDSGEYQESSSEVWPDESEYTFNSELSKCENGSSVYWDSTTKQVVMVAAVSDKCYIYFDKN